MILVLDVQPVLRFSPTWVTRRGHGPFRAGQRLVAA